MRSYDFAFRVILIFTSVSALSQQATQPTATLAGFNWQHVQALPIGTSIHVNAGKRHQFCNIKSIDADSLTCAQGKDPVYQRIEITSIKLTHRGRSTLVAMGIGAGVGAIIGAAIVGPGCRSPSFCIFNVTRTEGGGVAALALGIVGAPIGYFTDFTRSTIYKAP